MSERFIRAAVEADAARIAAIYNVGIADRVATFQTVPRGEADIVQWLRNDYPVMVCGDDGVMAFAR